ncbi:MAG TPA: hypothetical protein VH374_16720 [Polyangia bacterium]|nr:hypothetical protein [Polyangia bacterium]
MRVTFVDRMSGAVISQARMPVGRLPETFTKDTVLKMAGETYLVSRAEPATKAEFSASNQLKVFVIKHQP